MSFSAYEREVTLQLMHSPFFHDFLTGEEVLTCGRTVTRTDVVNFAGVSGDFDPLHLDTEYGKTTVFGENVAHGLCGLSVASGLVVSTGILRNIAAFYSIEHWAFRKPLFFGDTIRVQIKVERTDEGSKPDRGLVCLGLALLNQKDEVLQQGIWNVLIKKRA